MPDTTDILQKITQLTLIREEEPLVDVFFELMLTQFDSVQGVALYKLDQLPEGALLSLQACQTVLGVSTEIFNSEKFIQSLLKLLQKFLHEDMEREDSSQAIEGHSFLIKKTIRDKTSVFFLVYWLSSSNECDQKNGFIPSAMLKNHNKNPKLMNIHSLSDIYSNHQTMIYLNDKDALTGLYNRKSFDRRMHQGYTENEFPHRRSNEEDRNNFLAILDIDHFKKINDTFGHLYGDEVLLHFAQQMQKIFREDDGLFRYGGEEFIVILKNIKTEMAEIVMERFRCHIESYQFPKVEQLTVSIGYTLLEHNRMQSEIVDRADHALYFAKDHGRNNVAHYETLVKKGLIHEIITEDDIELF